MKFKELTTEQARQICKKHKGACDNCPIRRERTDKNGNNHTLFCYYVLKTFLDITIELDEIKEEEIKYTEELQKELKQLNDN